MLLPDLLGGAQALVGVRRRHADVDDRDVRLVRAHLQHQLVGVPRLADDLEAAVLEQPRDALAEEHRVLGQHDPEPLRAAPPPAHHRAAAAGSQARGPARRAGRAAPARRHARAARASPRSRVSASGASAPGGVDESSTWPPCPAVQIAAARWTSIADVGAPSTVGLARCGGRCGRARRRPRASSRRRARAARRRRRATASSGVRERGEELVAAAVHLRAAGRLDRAADQVAVPSSSTPG